MIPDLYDSVLSLLNEIGYLDYEFTKESKLTIPKNLDAKKINYPIVGFTYDTFFRIPYKCLIYKDIYNYGN